MKSNEKIPEITFKKDVAILNSGQKIYNLHEPGTCLGEVCPFYNPSDHFFRGEKMTFNGTYVLREYKGVLYVDPDDYEFRRNGFAIVRNSARCRKCGDELVSKYRHDFEECSCGAIFIDGGDSYLRRGAKNMADLEETALKYTIEDYETRDFF